MFVLVKELFVILVLSAATFFAARRVALNFITAEDFSRRRNTWLVLTVAAFVCPNFWLFIALAIPVLMFSGRRESNPAALYLFLLCVIPPVTVIVPMIGMSQLLSADIYLLLGLFVMVPAALRIRRASEVRLIPKLLAMDYLLLGYGVLVSIYYIHAESAHGSVYESTTTDAMRKAVVYFITIFIPYFVISRSCRDRRMLSDALASFTLSCLVMSVIALFESVRGWLLYADLPASWGVEDKFTSYVLRGFSLRATASTGHSLALGFLLAIAFGFWLYLQRQVDSTVQRASVFAVLVIGLLAAYSRGPWIGAACIYFVFAALSPRGFSKILRAAVVASLFAVVIYLSPFGSKIANVMPVFGGTVDSSDIEYRRRLFDRAWSIVKDNPILGDQHALLRMQDLRQGQGIIDLVNTYVGVLLGNGFVGLFLFLSFILVALLKTISTARSIRESDPDLARLGLCVASCIIGTLLMLENGSFATGPKFMFYALAGLAAAYSAVGHTQRTSSSLGGEALSKLPRQAMKSVGTKAGGVATNR
jgi:hypothetical protein